MARVTTTDGYSMVWELPFALFMAAWYKRHGRLAKFERTVRDA